MPLPALLERVIRKQKRHVLAAIYVRDAIATASKSRWKIERTPTAVEAFTDVARRAAPAFVIRDKPRQRFSFFPDKHIVFNRINGPFVDRPVYSRPSDVSNACPTVYEGAAPQPSSILMVPAVTTL